jgi:hypothetical protein
MTHKKLTWEQIGRQARYDRAVLEMNLPEQYRALWDDPDYPESGGRCATLQGRPGGVPEPFTLIGTGQEPNEARETRAWWVVRAMRTVRELWNVQRVFIIFVVTPAVVGVVLFYAGGAKLWTFGGVELWSFLWVVWAALFVSSIWHANRWR